MQSSIVLVLIAVTSAWIATLAATPGRGAVPRVQVTLKSSQAHYVLGEPVLLNVSVTSMHEDPIQAIDVFVEDHEPEIEIFISSGGNPFEQHMMGIYPHARVKRVIKNLAPGDSWSCKLRTLYTYKRPNRLAFPEPDDYRLKVRYPLVTPEPLKRTELESNTIEIRVKSPEGDDRKVWREVDTPEFLYFLQSGSDPKENRQGEGEIPMRAVRLLKERPKSVYAPALTWALEEYYQDRRRALTRDEALADKEMESIREAMGIKEPPPGPFSDDPRLEVPITFHYPKQTPLAEVFQDLSQQSGTPLRLDQALTIRTLQSAAVTQPLRKFMESMDAYKVKWVEDGDGYKLVPDDPPAKEDREIDAH